jgi:hypothetical protein
MSRGRTLVAPARPNRCGDRQQLARRGADPWLAADDFPWDFSQGGANLMVINPATGITKKNLAALSEPI